MQEKSHQNTAFQFRGMASHHPPYNHSLTELREENVLITFHYCPSVRTSHTWHYFRIVHTNVSGLHSSNRIAVDWPTVTFYVRQTWNSLQKVKWSERPIQTFQRRHFCVMSQHPISCFFCLLAIIPSPCYFDRINPVQSFEDKTCL